MPNPPLSSNVEGLFPSDRVTTMRPNQDGQASLATGSNRCTAALQILGVGSRLSAVAMTVVIMTLAG